MKDDDDDSGRRQLRSNVHFMRDMNSLRVLLKIFYVWPGSTGCGLAQHNHDIGVAQA